MRRLVVPLALALLALPLPAQEATTTVTTPSGLKIEILKEGTPGTAPQPGDRVKVHYTGLLTNDFGILRWLDGLGALDE